MENQVSVDDAVATDALVENDVPATAEEAVPPKKQKRRVNQQKLQDNLWGWIFCIPLIVGTVWFVYSALIMAVMLSFTNYHLSDGKLMDYLANLSSHIYVNQNAGGGFDFETGEEIVGSVAKQPFYWYAQIFKETVTSVGATDIQMNEMGKYLFNTVFYMIGIPIGMILAMFFAVCMSRDIKGGSVFRVLYYVPCVASTISIVFTFRLMFAQQGVMNNILGTDIAWLGDTKSWNDMYRKDNPSASNFMRDPYWCQGFLSKMVIVIMSVWKGLGGTIILYIAGLSGVNAATKEAAQIDGASGWKIFWKVTMPDLYPVIFYNIVTSVIGGLQIYAEPELLSAGNDMTSGYVALVFRYGLEGVDGGEPSPAAGAAYGLFLAVIIFILTLFQFWLDGRNKKNA